MRSILIVLILGVTLATAACSDDKLVLYIGPQEVPCTGVGPRTCLLAREDPDEDWHFFYDPIIGFTFEPGFYYTLLVRRKRKREVVADESSLRWTLIRILAKEPAPETL
jgi:heat shock protein HslJ